MENSNENYLKILSILNKQKENRKKYSQSDEGKQKLKEAKKRYYEKNKSVLNAKRAENHRKKKQESLLSMVLPE